MIVCILATDRGISCRAYLIDAVKIIDRIDQLIAAGDYENLFWDNAVIDSIPLLNPIRIERVDGIYEIDTVEELRELERCI